MENNSQEYEAAKLEQDTEMKELALKTGLSFDGGDIRLFYEAESISIFASDMTKAEYKKMQKDIDKYSIEGIGYTISGWNDISGYNYWSKDHNEANYIQVTAYISDLKIVDPEKLKADSIAAFNHFYSHDNSDCHDFNITEKIKPNRKLNILKKLGT